MKAVVLYENGIIKYEDYNLPNIENNMVKVHVKACGICGSDLPRVFNNSAHFYPIVLGHEFAGVIEEIGEGVENFKTGDHVAGIPLMPCYECDDCKNGNFSLCENYKFVGSSIQGAFADYIILPKTNVFKIAPQIPFEQGALFEPSTVALHSIFVSEFKRKKTVAILGGGTVGLFILQWVKILGASNVVVFGRDKNHLKLAQKLGADKTISILDFDDIYNNEALEKIGFFDYIYEASGAEQMINWSFSIAGKKSIICMVGTPKKQVKFNFKQWELINRKELKVLGSWMSYSDPFPGKEWDMTNEYFSNGKLKYDLNLFHKIFPMKNAESAFGLFRSGEKINGRILLKNDI